MNRVLRSAGRYVDWLSDQYRAEPGYLGVLRICFALWVLVLPTDYLWVAAVPDAFFQPRVGPFSLLTEVPPLGVLIGLQVLQALLALVLLVGYRTRTVSVLLTLVMISGSGIVYSFGKVDHFILFELLPLAMAAAGWGSAYSLDARRRRGTGTVSGFPILLWGLVVGYALLSAALPKAVTGWLDPLRHATRGYLARDIADPVRVGPFSELVFGVDWDLLWKLLDYGTLVAEAGVVVAVFYPPLLRLWLLAILGFHLGVYLTLGISFAGYVFVYVPFFAAPVLALVRRYRRTDPGLAVDPSGGPAPGVHEGAVGRT